MYSIVDGVEVASHASVRTRVTAGVLSYGAHRTLRTSLEANLCAGLAAAVDNVFVYFNAMTIDDTAIAREFGLDYFGSAANTGIFGGFKAIAEAATTPYVLILENDMQAVAGASLDGIVSSCVRDMRHHGIKVFSLLHRASAALPEIQQKYLRSFRVIEPLSDTLSPQPTPWLQRARMLPRHGYVGKFRGRAVFVEREPERAQPRAVHRLPSGNFVTDSRYRNWTNQALLVDRRFFLDVVCRRVETHPDPRLINGHQDIERALNSWWWRRRREPLGSAADGAFAHTRLDR